MSQDREPELQDTFLFYLSRDRHRIFRFIYSLLPNEADAEDVFQQTSIVLWKKFGEFDQSRDFTPWAYGVAYHTVRNFRRSMKNRHFTLDDKLVEILADEQTKGSMRDRYRLDLLQECLATLKTKDRDLIRKIYESQETPQAVSKALGLAVQTVYNRLNLIRRNLLACVNRKEEGAY